MPIITLLLSVILGAATFGFVLYAIEENPLYWISAVCFGFWAVVGFLKFLAMC